MNEQNLIQAIEECDHGGVPFNLGLVRAFLYGKKWYPLRGVVNYAQQLAGGEELTTDRALVALVYLGEFVRIKDIQFDDSYPVPLIPAEQMNEVHKISELLEKLARP